MRHIDPHCTLYVDAEITRSSLVNVIKESIDGEVFGADSVRNRFIEIYVDDNEDRNYRSELTDSASFLTYRYRLGVDPIGEHVRLSHVIEGVRNLLVALWAHEYAAVAASDYEDSLPQRGGYNTHTPRSPVE